MLLDRIGIRLKRSRADRVMDRQLRRVEAWLAKAGMGPQQKPGQPVLFFNASTRIHRLSLNGAYSLLASWGLRARGVSVSYVVCQAGMRQCILGTDRMDLMRQPPCRACIRFSERIYPHDGMLPLVLDPEIYRRVFEEIEGLGLEQLKLWERDGIQFGRLCLPGFRWVLRRHSLPEEGPILVLYRQFLASAASLARQFDRILQQENPRALVVFNGMFYPEAVARHVAERRGLPVITHEVGLRDRSAFFSHQDATFREVEVDPQARLSSDQNRRLDDYLSERFRGEFSMAGIRFWPEMGGLPDWLQQKLDDFKAMVTVFTNVIFDTSQGHANAIYETMFAWLDDLLPIIDDHPDTLFVLRAHPDEHRPGKRSMESVSGWVTAGQFDRRPNVVFLAPGDQASSYELIQRSSIVLAYNSSIGLEASIAGKPVICAGRARYTQIPTVHFPESRAAYVATLRRALREGLAPGEGHQENARSFLYHELYRASLDLSEFLEPYPQAPGMVQLTEFEPVRLLESPALSIISQGILEGAAFLAREDPGSENGRDAESRQAVAEEESAR